MVTLFTGPKSFAGHIGVIQDNAIASWTRLGAGVEVILIGDEPGLHEAAERHGVRHLANLPRTTSGTPRLDAIFAMARESAAHELLCYANADVILMPDLLTCAAEVASRFASFLIIGQRWDLDVRERLDFDGGWEEALRRDVAQRGRRHPPGGSDYFVFPRPCFHAMPAFALGRAGWDNWMIYHARLQHWPVIDASDSITVIHQDHDYAHLPDGKPHYRLPESDRNLELAGGRPTVFTLLDADWMHSGGRLHRRPLQWRRLLRRAEVAVYLALGPGKAARRARLLMHPVETIRSLVRQHRREGEA
ncbi:MAG: hypothetical protein NTU91_12210 [Chloroflexi bacterium]|nr:hypothetical protein [Chloroflexota bacterium]